VIVDIGIVDVLDTRVAVAFVDTAFVHPGIGDELLGRIAVRLRHLTHAPVMLYADDGRGLAAFQAHEFAKRIVRGDVLASFTIDTELDEEEYKPLPF
jgi:hypothetical protein